ncbi:MAG: hypothetical protein HKN20_17650 [Gemmatimonadetes bacterium]|nr:hypothetical protein [Gemmatimonadota bacterium]
MPKAMTAIVSLLVASALAHADVAQRLEEIRTLQDGQAYFDDLTALQRETPDARTLFAIAEYRFAVGAYAQAAEDYAAAGADLKGERRNLARVGEGLSRCAAGDVESGLAILEREAKERSSQADRARYLAAQYRIETGEHQKALEHAKRLANGGGDYAAPAKLLAARLLQVLGRKEEARDELQSIVKESPGTGEATAAEKALFQYDSAGAPDPGFYVQIASFSQEENAIRFAASKREEGMGAVQLFREERDGRLLFPVRVGPFETEEQAREAEAGLAKRRIEGNVVRVR